MIDNLFKIVGIMSAVFMIVVIAYWIGALTVMACLDLAVLL